MRCPGVGNPFRARLRLCRRGTFVALIQGVICASHEHFAPFQQSRGEKSRDRAKDDFLEKGGVHDPFYEAEAVPPALEEIAENL